MENNSPQNQISPEVSKVISSPLYYAKIKTIGDHYGLTIEQSDQLEIDTRFVLIGKEKASDFSKILAENLQIPMELATQLSSDINKEIFSQVPTSVATPSTPTPPPTPQPPQPKPRKPIYQNVPEPTPPPPQPFQNPDLSHLERAGNFVIEKRMDSHSPQYNDKALIREDVLNDIENIEKLKPQNAENYVEHLLGNPAPEKPTIPTPPRPQTPPPPPRKPGTDPYREAF